MALSPEDLAQVTSIAQSEANNAINNWVNNGTFRQEVVDISTNIVKAELAKYDGDFDDKVKDLLERMVALIEAAEEIAED